MKRVAFGLLLLFMFVLIIIRCGTTQSAGASYTADSEEPTYFSNTSPEDCYLCGGGIESLIPDHWGQNNVALFSLNTFEIVPLTINRYDRTGQLLEGPTGTASFGIGGSVTGGFDANFFQDYDNGHAIGMVTFYNDKKLDVSKTANFLCENCLNEILRQKTENYLGVGTLNLATKEVRVFEENIRSFRLGDFYIDCRLFEHKERMNISISTAPRWEINFRAGTSDRREQKATPLGVFDWTQSDQSRGLGDHQPAF